MKDITKFMIKASFTINEKLNYLDEFVLVKDLKDMINEVENEFSVIEVSKSDLIQSVWYVLVQSPSRLLHDKPQLIRRFGYGTSDMSDVSKRGSWTFEFVDNYRKPDIHFHFLYI